MPSNVLKDSDDLPLQSEGARTRLVLLLTHQASQRVVAGGCLFIACHAHQKAQILDADMKNASVLFSEPQIENIDILADEVPA